VSPRTEAGLLHHLIEESLIRREEMKIVPDPTGNTEAFLSEAEQDELNLIHANTPEEKYTNAYLYHKFRERILPFFPPTYDLINSETYTWLPEYLGSNPDLDLKPDLFICPVHVVQYQPPYNGSVERPGAVIRYGKVQSYGGVKHVALLLDGKKDLSDATVCNFMRYCFGSFIQSERLHESTYGMVFDYKTFALIEMKNKKLVYFKMGNKWTDPGTLAEIRRFVSSIKLSTLPICIKDACTKLGLEFCKIKTSGRGNITSVMLGSGAFGYVFRVRRKKEGQPQPQQYDDLALKIVITDDENSATYDVEEGFATRIRCEREYLAITQIMEKNATCANAVVGVVPGSFSFNKIMNPQQQQQQQQHTIMKSISYCAYLMPAIGMPIRAPLLTLDQQRGMLRALAALHMHGFIHGDARSDNCIIFPTTIENKYKWVDFVAVDFLPIPELIRQDVLVFLKSINKGNTVTVASLHRYSENITTTWKSYLLMRNDFIDGVLLPTPQR